MCRGASSLTNAELLAIFLRTGVKGLSAVDLAQTLLERFGSPMHLFYALPSQFTRIYGLGPAKVAQLIAASELARRALAEEMSQGSVLDTPDKVNNFLRLVMARPDREVFYVLFLSSRLRVIKHLQMFEGSLEEIKVYPRELIRIALEYHAAAMIVAHNHPSGHAEPSKQDIDLTDYLKKSLKFVDIRLLDHLIVTQHEVVSMAELKLL